MDVSTITSLVGSLGFPIVMCIILCYGFGKQLRENTKAINELTQMISNLVFGKQEETDDN